MKEHIQTDNNCLSPQGRNVVTVEITIPNTLEKSELADIQVPSSVKEEPGEGGRLPYVAPTIEVIEVRTEAGYALSGKTGRWDPTDW